MAIGGGNSIMLPAPENQPKFQPAFVDRDFDFVSFCSDIALNIPIIIFI